MVNISKLITALHIHEAFSLSRIMMFFMYLHVNLKRKLFTIEIVKQPESQ
jgi:hypothetical protein